MDLINLFRRGVFAVYKVKHFTSAEIVQQLKETLARDAELSKFMDMLKVGHGGTLDETATGVLAIGTGQGCQLLSKLLHGEKKYVVTGCLGVETDTYNEIGIHVNKMPYDHVTRQDLERNLVKYKGRILQTPPKYSALKRHGRRIADLTRSGIDVEVHPRYVTCHGVECIEFSPPHFKLKVTCGGGFFIRSLVHDLGKDLESCAHVTELCRTHHGPFSLEDMLMPDQWTVKNMAQAIQDSLEKFPENGDLYSEAKAG